MPDSDTVYNIAFWNSPFSKWFFQILFLNQSLLEKKNWKKLFSTTTVVTGSILVTAKHGLLSEFYSFCPANVKISIKLWFINVGK